MVNDIKKILRESFGKEFPHQIKSIKYWTQVLKGNKYALKILNTIMLKQDGFASDRQMNILRRAQKGDVTTYHSKN